ncbi:MAG: HAMP domain-containing histidine kinase [Eubacterium sp.]|nr:HAMP domain-containing histidine kinase [Eubacterium sp.]
MRKSIQARIALTFIMLTALVLLAIGVFQYVFLDRYYFHNKQNTLIESLERIRDWDQDSSDEIPESFDQFSSVNGLTYCVTDSTLTYWYTNSSDGNQMAAKLLGILLGKEDQNTEILQQTDAYTMLRDADQFSGLNRLELWSVLDDGSYYLVTTPIQSLSEAARISLRFYLYIGIAAVLIGAVVIWLVSGKLEKTVSSLRSEKEQLQRDIEEKTRIDEMRKEFLSNVSHELKTPIALIQGYAEGLRDNVNDDPESRTYYSDVIIDEAEKMNRMVRQITTLTQLENGEQDLEIETFDLAQLIRGVLENMKVLVEQKQASVFFEQEEPVLVRGDSFRIEEVITNYLTNALNHLDGSRTIDIRCIWNGDTVETTVFNTGTPIPEEELDKVWIKFYKVDKARTRAYGGSGIGLSIVKAIMDAHGQTCGVKNYENGVAFSFTLAAAERTGQE